MGVKKNFIYSLILTASNYIFPLIVYPYISRVLGVEGLGICNFADSIINYFILFSTIGVSIIGIREIAATKNDQKQLNTVYTSLIAHIVIPLVITCSIFVAAIFYIDKLNVFKEILFIGLGKIIGAAFLLDWFYKGIENFKLITIRTIVIKFIYIISVFVFIREQEDYLLFFFLTTLMVLINSAFNIIHSRHYISLQFDKKNYLSLFKPNCINGLYLFLNTMYSTLNVAFLGFVSTTIQVGYYTTATKVFGIILAVYTAFTGVLLPRMSTLVSENKMEEFNIMIQKSINALITFSVPIIIYCTILAPDIINFISGTGYEGAYIPAIISMPLIFIVGYEQILIIQIITPLKEDKKKLVNSIVGATVGIFLNILLVNKFLAIGATIVWALSEISVLITAQYFVTKLVGLNFPGKKLSKSFLAYLPLGLLIYFIGYHINNSFITLLVSVLITILYFVVLECFVLKNNFVINIIKINKRIKS